MPWCEPCERYLAPNSVAVDGSCPTCGNQVDSAPDTDHIAGKVPWHFWVVVGLTGIYLGWRMIQGIALLF